MDSVIFLFRPIGGGLFSFFLFCILLGDNLVGKLTLGDTTLVVGRSGEDELVGTTLGDVILDTFKE